MHIAYIYHCGEGGPGPPTIQDWGGPGPPGPPGSYSPDSHVWHTYCDQSIVGSYLLPNECGLIWTAIFPGKDPLTIEARACSAEVMVCSVAEAEKPPKFLGAQC